MSGRQVTPLAEHEDEVAGVWVRAASGRPAVISVAGDRMVRVTDLSDGTPLHAWDAPEAVHWGMSGGPEPLLICLGPTEMFGCTVDGTRRWSRSGQRHSRGGLWCGTEAFAAREGTTGLVAHRAADGEPLGPVRAASAVLPGHDGRLLALVREDAEARFRDLVTGEPLDEFPWREGLVPLALAGPDDRWGRRDLGPSDHAMDVGRRAVRRASTVFAGVIARSGDWYAVTGTGGENHPLWLWRLPEVELVAELGRTDLSGDSRWNGDRAVAPCAAARADGKDVLVTGGGDGRVVRVELPAAVTAPARDRYHNGSVATAGAVGAIPGVPPVMIQQIEWWDSEQIWCRYLDPDHGARAIFEATYNRRELEHRVVTGTLDDGAPVIAVNSGHGFLYWSPGSGHRHIPGTSAQDAIIGVCDHGRAVLVAWYHDARRFFHLDDGASCRDDVPQGAVLDQRLALVGDRPVVARLHGSHLDYDYDYDDQDLDEAFGDGFDLDGDASRGRQGDWRLVHADAHGRVLVAEPDGTLHRYEMATGTRLGAPIPAPRGTWRGARTGRLNGRDVVLIMAGNGIVVHDADTGARLLRLVTHCVTFDVTTVGEDGVLAVTEHGARDYRGLLMQ